MGNINKSAIAFIEKNHILNLSVSDGENIWAAPVFYIFHEKKFYFFSSETSKHIQYSEKLKKAAASIHSNPVLQLEIKGIQMDGYIIKAKKNLSSSKAFAKYIKKFSSSFSLPPKSILSPEIFGKVYNTAWFRFNPEKIIFMDNTVRFGYKAEIEF